MDIFNNEKIKSYDSKAAQTKFLLGGIGTGNVSIGSRGQMTDFEIFNEPSKQRDLPYTFFAMYSKFDGENSDARILEAKINPPYERPLGYYSSELAGLKRFDGGELSAAYPFVRVKLKQEELPLQVEMTAFTPFIPLDSFNSGLPGGYITYTVKNNGSKACDVSICGSFANPVGFNGYDLFHNMQMKSNVKNKLYQSDGLNGIDLCSETLPKEDRYYGNMTLVTPEKNYTAKPEWLNGAWWDGAHDFWDDFSQDGKLECESKNSGQISAFNNLSGIKIGSLCVNKTLKPNEQAEFRFILAWHFPNRANCWEGHLVPTNKDKTQKTVKNYYAYKFGDAVGVASYMNENRSKLTDLSEKFTGAMYNSSVDKEVIDAVMSTATVLRSTTCYRIKESGVFLAFEGCFENKGSCEGNCTHVWNYAETLAFLFPDLEQSMRLTEFLDETDEDGNMVFRANKVYDDPRWDMIPATDGQMGCIIRLYRDWKFSGDDELLKKVWTKAALALNFAFKFWDKDGDCVLESQQHNTYDIEFYNANSLTNSLFFAALKAGAEMAKYLDDKENFAIWDKAWKKGSEKMDKMLWAEDYYIQVLDDVDEFKYQYGNGCLSDQVFGQLLSHICGLGYILPEEHIKKAIYSVYKYNFKKNMSEHSNVQRCYALNDDAGLLLCSWPKGGRPRFPFIYADEVWSGIEYQVAAHLIYEGYYDEGIQIIKAVRDRYDGYKRNPFNEVECGNHYARSLASYGAYLAVCGYKFDLVNKHISFSPKINSEKFNCFFSTAKGWGIYSQTIVGGKKTCKIDTLFGDLSDLKIN